MERNKYIVAIVVGFLVILGLGIISIKLFRAKRSTAPEHDAMVVTTPTPSVVQQDSGVEATAYIVPEIISRMNAQATILPVSLQAFVGEAQNDVQVMSIEFAGGETGLQFTREVPILYDTITETFKEVVVRDRSLLAYRIGAVESTFAFRSMDPRGRVVITVTKQTVSATALTGYIIFE